MSKTETFNPTVYRREESYRSLTQERSGVLWDRSKPLHGEILVSEAISALHAQEAFKDQPVITQSGLVTLEPIVVYHSELHNLAQQSLWPMALPFLLVSEPATPWHVKLRESIHTHLQQTQANIVSTQLTAEKNINKAKTRVQHSQEKVKQSITTKVDQVQTAALATQLSVNESITQTQQAIHGSISAFHSGVVDTATSVQTGVVHALEVTSQVVLTQADHIAQVPGHVYESLTETWDEIKHQTYVNAIYSWENAFRPALALASHVISVMAISSAVALTLLFAGPIVVLESQSLITKAQNRFIEKPHFENLTIPEPTATESAEVAISSAEEVFSLKVADLKIESKVVANVDPGSSKEYTQALKQGIAHAKGTGLPDQLDQNKTIYLFAHSTDATWNILRYNAQFYALKDAEPGQKVELTFWGKTYVYEITEKVIVEQDDVSYLAPQMDEERLILQTCYPPGTTDKRLLVIAKPIEK